MPRNTETGEKTEMIEDSPGDIIFAATWQPGIRFRFWRNVHLFLRPTIFHEYNRPAPVITIAKIAIFSAA